MGLCLSCLRGSSDEDDVNESSSLLRNHHNIYSSDYIQEAELLKQQQRQQELNTIVNDLSDNLIDVSTFLNTSTAANSHYPHLYAGDEKSRVEKEVEALNDNIKDACKINFTESLFLRL
ncbi:uncharacterized protein CANTADRAFT_47649 [Suhomyces tanzawaensis NRRL Y-17324]|uniref:Uncharacterized protein n=1 Tax=Suhomyces tanzawaensis NRRL Y-17324 TaxID=984487 RepID=A0A1E4SLP0_9ASCO|nr:uncharacterized protein CANTADRAFT_47649 [Suhomyces tanzawaensis NRRL Y-17324]ODV80444.1 hypothetical protein CANTADRAFT_47649 [Suhomyces tanzawaensis NRRL Y-17324]